MKGERASERAMRAVVVAAVCLLALASFDVRQSMQINSLFILYLCLSRSIIAPDKHDKPTMFTAEQRAITGGDRL